MDRFTDSELGRLAETETECLVSIYMPTHRAGPEVRQDPIRLRNLLDEAETQLGAVGLAAEARRRCLQPARNLVGDELFWRNQGDGLAIFLGAGPMRHYRLPRSFDELVVVGSRYHIVPLTPLAVEDGRFYLLVLSAALVRLFEATRDTLAQRDVPDMPRSFDDLAVYVDAERQHQFHTRTAAPAQGARRPAVHFGMGSPADDAERKGQLREYCRMIDRAVVRVLAGQRVPLLLAADVSLVGLYGEVNHYGQLQREAIIGSPDSRRPEDLRDEAWKIVGRALASRRDGLLAAFEQAVAKGQGSGEPRAVLKAAREGRVATLLHSTRRLLWGRTHGADVAVHDARQPGDEDLVNTCALLTLCNGGRLVPVPDEAMPHGSLAAAIYRW